MDKTIKIRVWDKKKKTMTDGMLLPQFAGYLSAIYPKLGNEVYLRFTGVIDKNGNEIYEGDIIRYSTSLMKAKPRVVEYKQSSNMTGFNVTNRPRKTGNERVGSVEIIGDIYRNPKLLK